MTEDDERFWKPFKIEKPKSLLEKLFVATGGEYSPVIPVFGVGGGLWIIGCVIVHHFIK